VNSWILEADDAGDSLHRARIHIFLAGGTDWLPIVAWTWLSICAASALWILVQSGSETTENVDYGLGLAHHRLIHGPICNDFYYKSLPVSAKEPASAQMKAVIERHKQGPPTWIQRASPCFTVEPDSSADPLVRALGVTFAGAFGSKLVLDLLFAYVLGVAFQ